jgi:hypothetical protein
MGFPSNYNAHQHPSIEGQFHVVVQCTLLFVAHFLSNLHVRFHSRGFTVGDVVETRRSMYEPLILSHAIT